MIRRAVGAVAVVWALLSAPVEACWTVPILAVERVIDGDTVIVRVQVWLRLEAVETVRLLGVDTPEVHGPTREAGDAATAYTRAWLADRVGLVVWGCRRDSFGRLLGIVSDPVGASLAEALRLAGHTLSSEP